MYIYTYIIYQYLLIKLHYLLTVLSWLSKLPHTHSNLLLHTCIIMLLCHALNTLNDYILSKLVYVLIQLTFENV